MATSTLEAIKYRHGELQILDQLLLPHQVKYDHIHSTQDAWHAIRSMRVRGAPAIAMVGILGIAVELQENAALTAGTVDDCSNFIQKQLDYIVTSRPTAVNLCNMARDFRTLCEQQAQVPDATAAKIVAAFEQAACKTLDDDIRDNKKLGDLGAEWILRNTVQQPPRKISVLTHCNTGSLATAGYGTALGVVRSLYGQASLHHAFCTETRPYNQGSRLTAFELVHEKIPSTLITDSMAAVLMRERKESDAIVAVVVGADRIAANGDTANKVGTYALAVAARHHGLKFVVAAPCSTVDPHTASGKDIQIETRAPEEMTTISGPPVIDGQIDVQKPAQRISIAPAAMEVWNPAFDVTPASLIDCIVTERGAVEKTAPQAFDFTQILQRSD